MLSYRHAFHAGNHADVLKHLILLQIAEYMGEKPAPFWIIDTHAGAGRYALESAHAIARVVELAPQRPKDHLMVVKLSGRGDKDVPQVGDILRGRKS